MEHENYTVDVGTLAVYDTAVFVAGMTKLTDEDLQTRALKAFRLLLEKVRETKALETMENNLRKLEHQVIDFDKNPNELELPKTKLALPRLLKYDNTKVMTKWEKFAKENGIKKVKKRSRLIWSDEVKDWVPRWGRNSSKHIKEDLDIIREVKQGSDPTADPFKQAQAEKGLSLKKQRIHEMENTMRLAKKKEGPGPA
jgi:hypothetical protein